MTTSVRFEKIPTHIYADASEASVKVAQSIAALIRSRQAEGQPAVLGLATGSTPTRVYAELVRMHQEEGLSFKNVVTFNLDEYYPMEPTSLQSYVRFMKEHLFDHVDIDPANIHIPDGQVSEEEVHAYCQAYESKIMDLGGLDIQLLGIGRTGHIGFNEPGSTINSPTRLIALDSVTRIDAASDFFGEENVPTRAITMGVGSIFQAKKIFLMAWGEGKAPIIKRAIEGEVSDQVPASFLQEHRNVETILDTAAAAELTRIKTPWLVQHVDWNDDMIKRAVVWLCRTVEKPVLKLTREDYIEHGMASLVQAKGSIYHLNIEIFNRLQHTITGWPGGKPNADDSQRPERANPHHKRVVIFSPHPDDDVISMGGTFLRLVEQGHDVHVAYQTSGNIAVFDDDALRFVDFAYDLSEILGDSDEHHDLYANVQEFLANKAPGQVDSPDVQKIKGLIRRGEARAASRYVGLRDDQIHFQDLPFYETGEVRKNPLGQADIDITKALLKQVKPHQIYAAGDLSDPHGTHRVCLAAVFEAVKQLRAEGEEWVKDCWVWLYRGAWQEWGVEDIEMAVPISPDELLKKRRAIFKHQSQKDRPLFPGHDSREFWQRAEARNRELARTYDSLGLAEYEAMEAFVRWKG